MGEHQSIKPTHSHRGACLCGAVAFSFTPEDKKVTICHCGQCQSWAGGPWPSVTARDCDFELHAPDDVVKWVRSSKFARRGFCAQCGSALFWVGDGRKDHRDKISVSAGSLLKFASNPPFEIERHIFTNEQSDDGNDDKDQKADA